MNHPATPAAGRASAADAFRHIDPPCGSIYAASASLDKALSQLSALRSGLAAIRLPIDAAADRLDYSDDLLAILSGQLHCAAGIVNEALDRIQAAEEAEPRVWQPRAATLPGPRAIHDHVTVAAGISKRITPAPANDDELARLVAGLRGEVL